MVFHQRQMRRQMVNQGKIAAYKRIIAFPIGIVVGPSGPTQTRNAIMHRFYLKLIYSEIPTNRGKNMNGA
jgi:hypothetical protein